MRQFVRNRLVRTTFILAVASNAVACGFVTAPLSLATAEVASSGVRATEYGVRKSGQAASFVRDQGQNAAVYLRDSTVNAADASWRFLQETGANIRDDFFPETGAPASDAATETDTTVSTASPADAD